LRALGVPLIFSDSSVATELRWRRNELTIRHANGLGPPILSIADSTNGPR
jgi:hypothetical protein